MRPFIPTIILIAVAGIFHGCGGSSSSQPPAGGNGASVTTTVSAPAISTPTTVNSANAAKTANASKSLAASFTSTAFPSLSSMVDKPAGDRAEYSQKILSTALDIKNTATGLVEQQMMLGKQVALTDPSCNGGGTKSTSDTAVDPIVVTYTACYNSSLDKNGVAQYQYRNGTVSVPKSLYKATTVSLGAGGTISLDLTTITYSDAQFKIARSKAVQKVGMTFSTFDATAKKAKFSLSGYGSEINYVNSSSDLQVFKDFTMDMAESVLGTGTSAVTTTKITLDGAVMIDSYDNTGFTKNSSTTGTGMAFQVFALENSVTASSPNTNVFKLSGKFAIQTLPACIDGTYDISTQTAVISSGGITSAGQMTVNGVTIVFNADGSVSASTSNGTPITSGAVDACVLSL